MADATRLTNLEVTGKLDVGDDVSVGGDLTLALTRSDYTVTSDDATAAADTAPTKAEFDAVVTLVNEIKSDYNALVAKLTPGA